MFEKITKACLSRRGFLGRSAGLAGWAVLGLVALATPPAQAELNQVCFRACYNNCSASCDKQCADEPTEQARHVCIVACRQECRQYCYYACGG